MSKFCRICGKELLDDSQYCDGCGTAITEVNNRNQENMHATINQNELNIESAKYIHMQGNENLYEQSAPKNKKKSIGKEILLTMIGILVVIFIVVVPLTIHRMNQHEKILSEIRIDDDQEYFIVNQEEFANALAKELEYNNIVVTNVHEYNGSKWADKYRYDIELENGDVIYLTGNKKNNVERIIYRGDPTDQSNTCGKYVGTITSILEPTTKNNDLDDIGRKILKKNEEGYFSGSYTYKKIEFQWYSINLSMSGGKDVYDLVIRPAK